MRTKEEEIRVLRSNLFAWSIDDNAAQVALATYNAKYDNEKYREICDIVSGGYDEITANGLCNLIIDCSLSVCDHPCYPLTNLAVTLLGLHKIISSGKASLVMAYLANFL